MAAHISDARLEELRALPYAEYLATPEWRRRRGLALERAGWRCEWPNCPEKRSLHVHHRTYEHLGNERDEELRVLCVRHHQGLHEHLDGLRRLHWRVIRDVMHSGPFATFADFVEDVKRRFHAERIRMNWWDLHELLAVALRDVPTVVVRGYPVHAQVRDAVVDIPTQEAREILAALQISLTMWTMPTATWSDPDQVTAEYEAARERAYEMGVELSLEDFLR